MPDEALIGALEAARTEYSARQRAATGLMAALKGVTGALGKAGKALAEYPDEGTGLDRSRLTTAQRAFSTLRLRDEAVDPLLPELRRESKTLAAVASALADALVALRGEVVDVVRLGHAYAALQGAKVEDPALDALLPRLDQELQEGQKRLGATFGEALRDALAAQGITLGGRPPHFEIGRFAIEADFARRNATISYGKNLVTGRVPLSVEAVIRAYQRENKAITGRNEDANRWMEQLHTAWDTARTRRAVPDQRANIVACYFELVLLRQPRTFRYAPTKGGFSEYSRAQFAHDFYEFTNRRRLDYKGEHVFAHASTKSQTDTADKSIWIVEGSTPHEGRYISDVVFSKDE